MAETNCAAFERKLQQRHLQRLNLKKLKFGCVISKLAIFTLF